MRDSLLTGMKEVELWSITDEVAGGSKGGCHVQGLSQGIATGHSKVLNRSCAAAAVSGLMASERSALLQASQSRPTTTNHAVNPPPTHPGLVAAVTVVFANMQLLYEVLMSYIHTHPGCAAAVTVVFANMVGSSSLLAWNKELGEQAMATFQVRVRGCVGCVCVCGGVGAYEHM